MRQVPGHWRAQILQTAKQVERRGSRVESQNKASWIYQLLWPCPQAWGALAAVWVLVLVLNFAGSEKAEVGVAKASVESREVLMAVKQQSRFRAELMSASDTPVAEPPKMSAPQSRIESFVSMTRV